MKPDLIGLNTHEIKEWAVSLGIDAYRGRQIQHWLFKRLASSFEEMTDLSKSLRALLKEKANIRVVKFFKLEEISEGIFLDKKERFHAYIELPEHFEWEAFNDLSNRVKYNWEGSKFDAAVGAFYHQGRLREFVRIYSNKLSLDYLEQIKKLYYEKMK